MRTIIAEQQKHLVWMPSLHESIGCTTVLLLIDKCSYTLLSLWRFQDVGRCVVSSLPLLPPLMILFFKKFKRPQKSIYIPCTQEFEHVN